MKPFPSPDSHKYGVHSHPSSAHARSGVLAGRKAEAGAGHLKAIIWTLILASLVYVMVKVVPILLNEYEFKDSIQNIARNASVNPMTNDQILKAVLKEAEDENLPVEAKDIKVDRTGRTVRISADISVTVDLNVYQWTLNFHPEASNESLI